MGFRRLTVVVALMLVTSLTASAWASCMAGIGMTAKAQMACCKAGHEKCPMRGTAEDCCKTEARRQHQVTVATHELVRSMVHPPAWVPAVIPAAFVPVLVRVSRLTFAGDVLKGPSPPRYLLDSAFLI